MQFCRASVEIPRKHERAQKNLMIISVDLSDAKLKAYTIDRAVHMLNLLKNGNDYT